MVAFRIVGAEGLKAIGPDNVLLSACPPMATAEPQPPRPRVCLRSAFACDRTADAIPAGERAGVGVPLGTRSTLRFTRVHAAGSIKHLQPALRRHSNVPTKVRTRRHDSGLAFGPGLPLARERTGGCIDSTQPHRALAGIQYDVEHRQFRLRLHLRCWLQQFGDKQILLLQCGLKKPIRFEVRVTFKIHLGHKSVLPT